MIILYALLIALLCGVVIWRKMSKKSFSSPTPAYYASVNSTDEPIRKVMIIGGGIGGLALAQYLKTNQSKIKVELFERDTSAVSRIEGYLLGINEDGVRVLNSLNRPGLNTLLREQKGKGFSVVDASSLELISLISSIDEDYPPFRQDKPGIVDRFKLREELTKGIEDCIVWGKKYSRYEETKDGRIQAIFEDGTSSTGDLLIGADGVNSKVRTQRSPDLLIENTHVRFALASIKCPSVEELPLLRIYSKKNMVRLVGNQGNSLLLFEYNPPDKRGEDYICWALSWREETNDEASLDQHQMLELVRQKTQEFHPEIKKLIGMAEKIEWTREYSSVIALDYNPLAKVDRVTLLGDAAHAMTTHRGLGANTALQDAYDLGQALIEQESRVGVWKKVMAVYNDRMMRRGFKAVRDSRKSTEMIHSKNTTMFRRFMKVLGFILWVRRRWIKLRYM